MYRGHIYVYMCPYTCVCYPHTCVQTYMNFAHVYVSCIQMLVHIVRVRVCVFLSERECVSFYSRKIAHRGNFIFCIMCPTINKSRLVSSCLASPRLVFCLNTRFHHLISPLSPRTNFCNLALGRHQSWSVISRKLEGLAWWCHFRLANGYSRKVDIH